ncbi:N,N-dimethylformamidase beta subunit family domain-containing protein [Geodermatophilus sp. SYSU D00697]
MLALLLAVVAPLTWGACSTSVARPNPVVVENQHPGTESWQITRRSDDVHQQVKGYASAVSVDLGESITFFVTVNPVQGYSIDVYRFGYYQGLGGRLMQHVDAGTGVTQPSCPVDPTTGMVSCDWSPNYTLDVPTTWTSGVYLAKLTNAEGFENYITFVVRDDDRRSALLYQQSVTTYQAYNNYPYDAPPGASLPATGKSLYDFNSSTMRTGLGTQRAVKVSYDRPYSAAVGRRDGSGQFTQWESYYVRWLEQRGFDVTYTTNVDVDRDGGRLLKHRGFLSVGHDEYWSARMYDAAEDARDQGVGLGFFGANSVVWQIRFEPSANGRPHRVQVCYKDAGLDPVEDSTETVLWRDPPLNRPEQQLLGTMTSGMQLDTGSPAMFIATNTWNWVYAGTGLSENEPVAAIVGYETDGYDSGYPPPTARAGTYTRLSHSPYIDSDHLQAHQQSSVYQAPSGAWVFNAGTIQWSWGLFNGDGLNYADPRIQRMTANVLNRMTAGA